MKTFQLSLLTIAMLLCSLASVAQVQFQVNNITYETLTETAVEVHDASEDLENVVIPSTVAYDGKTYTVTSIGEWAFVDCSSLTSINIPNNVTSIENLAFPICSGLIFVNIGNSVTSIGAYAFRD